MRQYFTLAVSFVLFATCVAGLEIRLAHLGYEPTVVETPGRWIRERQRATDLGKDALILVGASRMQLGFDLDVLRRETRLMPVQLSIDASSPIPILAGLASDPSITGTILVDYYDTMLSVAPNDAASRYQRKFEKHRLAGPLWTTGDDVEEILTTGVHDHLRSFADGATPMQSLKRAFAGQPPQSYLTPMADRSRRADYRRVPMPDYYHMRVMRELGLEFTQESPGLEEMLKVKVDKQQPESNGEFVRDLHTVRNMVGAIRRRGGKVLFVKMPTSGLIGQLESQRYPRKLFWDELIARAGAPGLWTADEPELARFKCPDGSHLDMRDQASFSHHLIRALGLSQGGEPKSLTEQ